MLEAIALCERIAGRELDWTLADDNRIGDHRWWISDLEPFKRDYPDWDIRYGVEQILVEIHDQNIELWTAAPRRFVSRSARAARPRSCSTATASSPSPCPTR